MQASVLPLQKTLTLSVRLATLRKTMMVVGGVLCMLAVVAFGYSWDFGNGRFRGVADPSLMQRLSGSILLQVEENGEAWYVSPIRGHQRFYMGRPADAFQLMREHGFGITNANLAKIPIAVGSAPPLGGVDPLKDGPHDAALTARLSGYILLQVEENGEAWYVHPRERQRYYLGRPADAFAVMRFKGLGITNADLSRIPIHSDSADPADVAPRREEDPSPTPISAPTASNANRIVFNRGVPLSEVINRITITRGGSLWTADPDKAESVKQIFSDSNGSAMMPAWNAVKDRLVFASNHGDSSRKFLNLWTVDADGSSPHRLTTTQAHDWTPAWSPDGDTIAFASTRGKQDKDDVGGLDIWLVDADGSDARVLYAGSGQDEDPVFSRDSKTVYFIVADYADYDCTFQLWSARVAPPHSAAALRDANNQLVCGEDVSAFANGLALLYSRGDYLYTYNLSTQVVSGFTYTQEPWVGPDGNRFTFMLDGNVWVSRLDGSQAKQVTFSGDDYFPRWIP